MQTIRRRLTYANVVATLALFLAIGGGAAFAATHLNKNSVGSLQLRNGAVTTAKIKGEAVTGAKIRISSLGKVPSAQTADRADAAVTAATADRAATADTAANAATLQGSPADAFLRGGGQFLSGRRQLAAGATGVTLLRSPESGP